MKKLTKISKPFAARIALTLGMTALWVQVSQVVLGAGFSPVIVGVVLGYGLTDRFIAAASSRAA